MQKHFRSFFGANENFKTIWFLHYEIFPKAIFLDLPNLLSINNLT